MPEFYEPYTIVEHALKELGEKLSNDVGQLNRAFQAAKQWRTGNPAELDDRDAARLLSADWRWHLLGKPFFRLHPNVSEMLASVGLDLPADSVTLPYGSFVIKLPKGDPTFTDGSDTKRAIWVAIQRVHASKQVGFDLADDASVQRTLDIFIEGERADLAGKKTLAQANIQLGKSLSLEAPFGNPIDTEVGVCNIGLIRRCFAVAMSVCFLATGRDKLVEPHVLSKDLQAYIDAHRRPTAESAKQIETIVERAKRRVGVGFEVGRNEARRIVCFLGGTDSDSTGRHIGVSYQRRAHFRVMPSGKVVFVRQHTVRPDLIGAE